MRRAGAKTPEVAQWTEIFDGRFRLGRAGLVIAVAFIAAGRPAAYAQEGAAKGGDEGAEGTEVPAATSAAPDVPAGGGGVPAGRDREFSHPYGAVEFGIGILALPDAEVCGGGEMADCDQGDVSLEVDAWPLFRASPSFAVGAGMTLALTPTQNAPEVDTEFPREHTRRYFLAEGVGRYYAAYGRSFEIWVGISAGLIVVSDNFRSRSAPRDAALIGADSANIATEGMTLGLGTGFTLGATDVLQVGGTLRVANWFLPSRPDEIAFGERASLSDRVTMVNLSLTVAYHGR